MSEEENKQKPIRNVRFKDQEDPLPSESNKENTVENNIVRYNSK
jgi:hypothetical protein